MTTRGAPVNLSYMEISSSCNPSARCRSVPLLQSFAITGLCLYAYIYIYIYIYIYTHTHTYIYIHAHVHRHELVCFWYVMDGLLCRSSVMYLQAQWHKCLGKHHFKPGLKWPVTYKLYLPWCTFLVKCSEERTCALIPVSIRMQVDAHVYLCRAEWSSFRSATVHADWHASMCKALQIFVTVKEERAKSCFCMHVHTCTLTCARYA
jgi:hypothetical protein